METVLRSLPCTTYVCRKLPYHFHCLQQLFVEQSHSRISIVGTWDISELEDHTTDYLKLYLHFYLILPSPVEQTIQTLPKPASKRKSLADNPCQTCARWLISLPLAIHQQCMT